MTLENLWIWGQLKGIKVLSAADFTHPLWFAELQEKLEPAESGLYKLKSDIEESLRSQVPESCRSETRFILTTEISCIYSKKGRTRKVHCIVFAPSLETVQKINHRLGALGNLRADGRPILGMDPKLLFKIVLDASRDCLLVPAHAWTPHFAVFGSQSGFDSLKECFEELTPHIYAIETGLSSDPAMNWRVSQLDALSLISNSDAHSLPKLGRECTVFNAELSYYGIAHAFKKDPSSESGIAMTVEFFPEEGKYHYDGHRACSMRFTPTDTKEAGGQCPTCKKAVTVGVASRVEALADRVQGYYLPGSAPFKKLIPLQEIIGEALNLGSGSAAVEREYRKLIGMCGSELKILLKTPLSNIAGATTHLVAEAIKRVRDDAVIIEPGFDGEYGTIHIFSEQERHAAKDAQTRLF